jgi:ankyrin repeat protein
MKCYKIINKEMKHNNMEYKEGLNICDQTFNPSGSCTDGGMYFSQEDILAFLEYGEILFEVELLEDSRVYEDPYFDTKKWKTDKFILKNKREINLETIKYLAEEGANIHVDNDLPLCWAAKYGHLDIVKYFVVKGANIPTDNDLPLCRAAENGHLEVVKYLVKKGADIHVYNEYPLCVASEYGYLEIVKYLIEQGANNRVNNDYPLRIASEYGHLSVVMYLKEVIKKEKKK